MKERINRENLTKAGWLHAGFDFHTKDNHDLFLSRKGGWVLDYDYCNPIHFIDEIENKLSHEVTEVYTFDITTDVHESAMYTESIHKTKAGAYRAMRAYLMNECNKNRDQAIQWGNKYKYRMIYDHIFSSWRWRINKAILEY